MPSKTNQDSELTLNIPHLQMWLDSLTPCHCCTADWPQRMQKDICALPDTSPSLDPAHSLFPQCASLKTTFDFLTAFCHISLPLFPLRRPLAGLLASRLAQPPVHSAHCSQTDPLQREICSSLSDLNNPKASHEHQNKTQPVWLNFEVLPGTLGPLSSHPWHFSPFDAVLQRPGPYALL